MVNNAGVALEARRPGPCHLTDEEIWDTTMNINAKSVFLGCKYAITQMLKQEPHFSGDRGWIINMSSIMGIISTNDQRELRLGSSYFLLPDCLLDNIKIQERTNSIV